jgi:hypothetical protein
MAIYQSCVLINSDNKSQQDAPKQADVGPRWPERRPALLTIAHARPRPAAAPAEAPKPDTVRPDLYKLLDPTLVKQLMADKKYAEVQDNLTKADAFPDKTPYEIGQRQ